MSAARSILCKSWPKSSLAEYSIAEACPPRSATAPDLDGVAEDIDDLGALLVRVEGGAVERVLAGDVEQVRGKSK